MGKEIPDQIFSASTDLGAMANVDLQTSGWWNPKNRCGYNATGLPEKATLQFFLKLRALANGRSGYHDVRTYFCSVICNAFRSCHPADSGTQWKQDGDHWQADDYTEQQTGIPEDIIRLGINLYGVNEGNTWEKWLQKYQPTQNTSSWKADDLLTIIYTSRNHRKAKGVMHG